MVKKNIMREHFLELDEAAKDPNKRVAWCTSVGPAEILRAMGFYVFFPENHGALLGATRSCMETIPVADSFGYSPDICSYLRSDIGAYKENFTPLTKAFGIEKVPKPDVLVYNTNQCKDVMHWFEYYGKEFEAPVFGIHPPTHLPAVTDAHITDVAQQFEKLIGFLEEFTGEKCDALKLEKAVSLSKKATDLWAEVLELAQSKPSPFTFFDATIFMGPIVVMRGTQEAYDYYQDLLVETKQKVKDGFAAISNESKRIYWDGMPVWGRLRAFSELFKENDTCVVASTYCNSWIFSDFDPADPLRSMAKAYLSIFINRNDRYKEEYMLKIVEDYDVDGIVFHNAKTCPNNSNSQYNLPNRLLEKNVRSVTIDGDLCDLRCLSDEQANTIIEAFLETI